MHYLKHEDDEWFDEVRFEMVDSPVLRLIVVPRFKTSDLSGDEWRVSAKTQVMCEYKWDDLDTGHACLRAAAAGLYPGIFSSHPDLHSIDVVSMDFYRKRIKAYRSTYDGKELRLISAVGHLPWTLIMARENSGIPDNWYDYCFQPGCSERAVSVYELKYRYCHEGHAHAADDAVRKFCQKHLRRGDCGLEDADENYTVVSGPGPHKAAGWQEDKSPSQFGGVVEL